MLKAAAVVGLAPSATTIITGIIVVIAVILIFVAIVLMLSDKCRPAAFVGAGGFLILGGLAGFKYFTEKKAMVGRGEDGDSDVIECHTCDTTIGAHEEDLINELRSLQASISSHDGLASVIDNLETQKITADNNGHILIDEVATVISHIEEEYKTYDAEKKETVKKILYKVKDILDSAIDHSKHSLDKLEEGIKKLNL